MRYAVVVLAACGRLGFDARATSDASGDAPSSDTPADAAIPIAYVKPAAQRHPGAASSDAFALQASAAGNAILLQTSCGSSVAPTTVGLAAPGWTFTVLHALGGIGQLYSQSYIAFAPDTAMTTATVTWDVTCDIGVAELGDEFTNVGALDGWSDETGTGNCSAAITTNSANDAIWGACFSATSLVGLGAGYTMGADDGGGDWAEYKITTDPAGTLENVDFTNNNVPNILDAIELRPR